MLKINNSSGALIRIKCSSKWYPASHTHTFYSMGHGDLREQHRGNTRWCDRKISGDIFYTSQDSLRHGSFFLLYQFIFIRWAGMWNPARWKGHSKKRKKSFCANGDPFFLLWPSSAETLSFSPRPSQTCLLIILHTIDINKDGGHVSTSFNCKNSEAKIFQLWVLVMSLRCLVNIDDVVGQGSKTAIIIIINFIYLKVLQKWSKWIKNS